MKEIPRFLEGIPPYLIELFKDRTTKYPQVDWTVTLNCGCSYNFSAKDHEYESVRDLSKLINSTIELSKTEHGGEVSQYCSVNVIGITNINNLDSSQINLDFVIINSIHLTSL